MDLAESRWRQLCNDVIDILQKQGYILYLTFWLLVLDMTLIDWQLWAIVIPTIILANWKCKGGTR